MSAYTGQSLNHPKGYNDGNHFYVEHTLQQALSASDTLALTLPDGYELDSKPISMICYAPESSSEQAVDTDIALTKHNNATGVTTLTASGAVAIGSKIIMGYLSSLRELAER